MQLSDLSTAEHRRIEVAVHEAGHAVAAVLAGGVIDYVRLLDDPETPGVCVHSGVSEHDERGVGYAGPWCEARWIHGERPHLSEVLAVIASNESDRGELLRTDRGLPREIENRLELCWSAISKLAGTLYVSGRLDHVDVADALGFNGDNDGSVRAMIAAGFRPTAITAHAPLAG